jgi:hypothetical protein
MTPKMSTRYTDADANWQWPEKTWFRERLNALKAREYEQRRKPLVSPKTPTLAAAPDATDAASDATEKDSLEAD